MPIAIQMLGTFRVTVDGSAIDEARWGRRKSRTLVKILALQPLRQGVRQIHREELIETLWPGLEAEQGLNNLHKTLHAARRALEPGLSAGGTSKFLAMREQMVLLQGEELSVDLTEFEALADEALRTGTCESIQAALALYEGDLLPEDIYEDWSTVRRERLRSRKEHLLFAQVNACEAAGDTAGAADACRQLIEMNPCNEAAHRGLMKIYAAEGKRHLAAEQFRACADALKRELGAEPEAETSSLYQRVLAGGGEAAPAAEHAVAPVNVPVKAGGAEPPRPKRVRRLYAAAAVLAIGGGCVALYPFVTRALPAQSVAIMPLAPGGDSPELNYLAEGITESVINDLSQLRPLRVMARSTVYRYRAKGMEPMAAAAEMKVRAVLTGTLAQRGDRLLLNAELVQVPDGTRLWGNRYELSAQEATSVQDRIAAEVARALGVSPGAGGRTRFSPAHQPDPETYRLYLQARFFWNQRSKAGYLKSIDLFQAAIARDPEYAAAYAGLADSYGFLGRDEAPTPEYMPKARVAAQRALAIDDRLAEAHASLAMMSNVYDWNFEAADRGFRRALELDPGYATTHLYYGVFLAAQGRFAESQQQLDLAAEIDPLAPIIALCRGYPAGFRGDVRKGIRAAREALDLSPGFPAAIEELINYADQQGNREEAVRQSVDLLRARGQEALAERFQDTFQHGGYAAAVRIWLEAEESRAAHEYVSPLRIAQLAIRAGDLDKAYGWLERAVEGRNAGLVYLAVDPKYAPLRGDARFPALARRIGLRLSH